MSVYDWSSCHGRHSGWTTSPYEGPYPSPWQTFSGKSKADPQASNDDTIYGKDGEDVPIGGEVPVGSGEVPVGGADVPAVGADAPVVGNSSELVSTGTGTGHYFNVTNNTGKPQYFAFSAGSNRESGYSNNVLAVMQLDPGETGTFEAGDDVPGIRISTSGPNGETNPHQVLFEDTIGLDPMGSGRVVHNPDVSAVDGTVGYDGEPEYISISDGIRTIGHGTTTGVYDYDTEDTDPNWATNPMNMALNPATTYDIIFW